jgi:hypothetical protein
MERKDWLQRSLNGKLLLAVDKSQQPNTNKPSTEDQNKLIKGIFILTLAVK